MSGENQIPLVFRVDAASEEVFAQFHSVSADYFSMMGIDVLAGRAFGPTDHASSERVAIVSQDFVDQYFPVGTPVERVVGRVLGDRTVIGVVQSTRQFGPDAPVQPDVYGSRLRSGGRIDSLDPS